MIYIQDVENIPLRRTKEILEKLRKLDLVENVKQFIAISKMEIYEQHKELVEDLNFQYILSNKDADLLLKFVLKIKQENNENFIIVSSDSDFVQIVKELIGNDKKVIWVANTEQSKRILMKSSLTEKNLKFVLFDFKKNKKKYISKKEPEENKKHGKFSFSDLVLLREEKIKQEQLKEKEILEKQKNLKKETSETGMSEKRFKNIIHQIIHSVYRYTNRPIEKCDICGEEKECEKHQFEKNCLDCSQKLIIELSQRKDLTHEEKMTELKNRVEAEKKEGKIIYYENARDFLINRSLSFIQ